MRIDDTNWALDNLRRRLEERAECPPDEEQPDAPTHWHLAAALIELGKKLDRIEKELRR